MTRPAKSTAKFISYDLRPAKQSERGMLVDVLKIGGDCGLGIREYRYVGMGANRFYDFLLLHKYLGIRDMISLEHDEGMYARAVYNVPYRFIDVRHTTVVEFLANDQKDKPEILWLDYDGGISQDIVADIMNMANRLKQGDFCFITVSGRPPRVLDRSSDADRYTKIRESMGDLAGEVTVKDVEQSSFPLAVHKILFAAFRNAFALRRDGTFVPLVQVEYADSTPMVTVGGAMLSDDTAAAYRRRMKHAFPYLSTDALRLYDIRSFNLTERERSLFDRASTAQSKRSPEWNALKKLGFKEADFQAYNQLIRYLPRYVETIV